MKENYLTSIKKQFQYYKLLGDQTFSQIEAADIFWKYHPEANSIAIIVKHLWGNMKSRWTDFLTTDGEKEWRQRDQEFVEDIKNKEELLAKWEDGWQCLFTAIDAIDEDNFDTIVYIRNMGHSIVEAINRQLAHYAYHVGQIVFIGTLIKGDAWKSLSIPKGQSSSYNQEKFKQPKRQAHFTDEFLNKASSSIEIKNLKETPLKDIVECLLEAFDGYFVQMPSDVAYWRKRYQGARVDFEYCYGAFDKGKLVAFIINGVDRLNGHLTAFNTGTGVLPAYRGRQLVDKIYAYAIPLLKEKGITKCVLEVIQDNARAIRVYQRIGFAIQRNLNCYKGTLSESEQVPKIKKIDFSELQELGYPKHNFYSWDHTNDALVQLGKEYETYTVVDPANQLLGYFIINPTNGRLAQVEVETEDFATITAAISQVAKEVRIVNVDDRRVDLIENLLTYGLQNTINQYEMEMDI